MAYTRAESKLEGGEELIAKMEQMGINVRKALTGSLKAGGKVIGDEAEARAGSLSKSRGKATSIKVARKSPDHVTVNVGPSKKKFYLRFLETGVQPHEIKGKGFRGKLKFYTDLSGFGLVVTRKVHHPGFAARPWLRPAFDAKNEAATKVIGENLRAAIVEQKIPAEGGE